MVIWRTTKLVTAIATVRDAEYHRTLAPFPFSADVSLARVSYVSWRERFRDTASLGVD